MNKTTETNHNTFLYGSWANQMEDNEIEKMVNSMPNTVLRPYTVAIDEFAEMDQEDINHIQQWSKNRSNKDVAWVSSGNVSRDDEPKRQPHHSRECRCPVNRKNRYLGHCTPMKMEWACEENQYNTYCGCEEKLLGESHLCQCLGILTDELTSDEVSMVRDLSRALQSGEGIVMLNERDYAVLKGIIDQQVETLERFGFLPKVTND